METIESRSPELLAALSRELVQIARYEERIATHEASRTPYWSPTPSSVEAHRAAARALRLQAEQLESEARTITA